MIMAGLLIKVTIKQNMLWMSMAGLVELTIKQNMLCYEGSWLKLEQFILTTECKTNDDLKRLILNKLWWIRKNSDDLTFFISFSIASVLLSKSPRCFLCASSSFLRDFSIFFCDCFNFLWESSSSFKDSLCLAVSGWFFPAAETTSEIKGGSLLIKRHYYQRKSSCLSCRM